jgi:hypothetical protein
VLGCAAASVAGAGGFRGDRLLLTWQEDPTTTMTIQWIEAGEVLVPVEGGAAEATPAPIPFVGAKALDATNDTWSGRGTTLAFLADADHQRLPADVFDAELRLGWNHDGLLVRARVTDPDAVENDNPAYLWAGDSVELFVSDAVGSNHRYHVALAPGRAPGGEPRHVFFPKKGGPRADKLTADLVATATVDGYVIEVLLPWSNLPGAKIEEGAGVAVQVYVNSRSGGGTAPMRIGLHPGLNTHDEPAKTVAFVLAGADEAQVIRARATAATNAKGRSVVRVFGVPELAGTEVVLRSGGHEPGRGVFEAGGRHAFAELAVSPAQAGRAWQMAEIVADGQVLTAVDLSELVQGGPPEPTLLRYWPAGAEEGETHEAATRVVPLAKWRGHYRHRVQLTGLKPGTDYRFRAEGETKDLGFRTMPERLTRPVRFAQGGDTRHQKDWLEATNTVAMRYDPDFVVWGGDFAYADGLERNIHLWEEWFEANNTTLIGEGGRVVPIIGAIGNHEVVGGYYSNSRNTGFRPTDGWRERIAPYFYQFFAFPGQPGYGALDFGDYLSIIVLDTGHTNPIAGPQTEWLERALVERKGRPHVFPVYHVPAYPSQRSYHGHPTAEVREHWVPVFERHGVEVAFEHHDHTYKRTHPIRGGKVSPDGIVYFGDGAWGVAVRPGGSREEWYIDRFAAERHAIIVTLEGTRRHFLVVDAAGRIIDEYPRAPVTAP